MRKIISLFAMVSLLLMWTVPAMADVHVEVFMDDIAINTGLDTTTTHYVNYSINITNVTGTNTNPLNATINITFHNCTWSNWNFTNLTGDSEPINFYVRSNASNFSASTLNFNETWNKSYTTNWTTGVRYLVINISQPCDINVSQYYNLTLWLNVTGCSTTARGLINISVNVTDNNATVAPTFDTGYANILWAATSSLRVTANRTITDVLATADTVTTIIGIVLIISAIMAIIGLMYNYMGKQ